MRRRIALVAAVLALVTETATGYHSVEKPDIAGDWGLFCRQLQLMIPT